MINGFIVIDKPAGITSHDVVSRVRRILGTKKVGHTGTLDPFATGVLPIAVNDGTKAIPYLDESAKRYTAVLKLGITTDTLDLTGTVLKERDCAGIDKAAVASLLHRFTGRITQIPPMFSAIKQNGQPLYRLARQGVEVERKPREVEIHRLDLVAFQSPLATIDVTCSRGTYIRTLADDMGAALGCGAALQALRRLASGRFEITSSHTLEALEGAVRDGVAEDMVISPLDALSHLPEIELTAAGYEKLRFGRQPGEQDCATDLTAAAILRPSRLVRLSFAGKLAAVAAAAPDSGEGVSFQLKRVFV